MITRAIFDSGVLIGSQDAKDQYAVQASEILKYFKNKTILRIYITDYVLVETVNFLLKRSGFEKARIMLDFLLNTEDIEIIYTDNASMERIKELFNKYKNLSITDCSLVVLAEKFKIKEIFSFDKNFDSVKGIKRLTSI